MRYDLNLLRAFTALLEERSVTRAAHRLGMTQPALSNTLVRLLRPTSASTAASASAPSHESLT